MIVKASRWQRAKPAESQSISEQVTSMLQTIQTNGASAIEQFAQTYDGQKPQWISLQPFDSYPLAPELKQSILLAANRIERFAQFQKSQLKTAFFEDEFGRYGQVVNPIERIGAYIPGGRYPLISTALMTLIPAKVAGCPVRVACSPSADPALLAAASLAGATEFIQLGGVQAIAAMTFGYQTLQPVSLVVGPGNAWVNQAKSQLQSRVKIDGLAGPSELMALCDDQQPIEWLALDALAQAEHDPMAVSILVSDSRSWLVDMLAYLEKNQDTRRLLKDKQIELVLAESIDEMIQFSEQFAPEHLMLCHQDISESSLNHYGSLFVGANSAVALGDYISGPNHTLPTLGFAKQSGGLNVNTYLKVSTVQTINEQGRNRLSNAATAIANAEGLEFHFQSLRCRIQPE